MILSNFPIIGEPIQGFAAVNLIIGCFLTLIGMGTFIYLLYQFTSKSVKLIKMGENDEKIDAKKGKLAYNTLIIIAIVFMWILLAIYLIGALTSIYLIYLDPDNSVSLGNIVIAVEKYSDGWRFTSDSLGILSSHPYFFGAIVEFCASICGFLLLVCAIVFSFLVTSSYSDIKKATYSRYQASVNLQKEAKKEQVKEELAQLKDETDNIETITPVIEPEIVQKVVEEEHVKQKDIKPQYTVSYFGKLAMMDKEVQQRYSDLKNEILKYTQVSNLKSSKGEKFNLHRDKLIKIIVKGKTIVAYFNIDKSLLADSNIRYEEFKPTRETEDYTVRVKLINSLRTKHAISLADLVIINKGGSLKRNYVNEDFTVDQITVEEAVEKGLAKRNY